jgi:hypothetical protein
VQRRENQRVRKIKQKNRHARRKGKSER